MLEALKDEERPKGFVPRVVTGGKGPPQDTNEFDWISSIPINTTVLIQSKKNTEFPLGQLRVVHKFQKAVVVFVPDQSPKPIPIDPVRFCSQFRLYEVIQTAEEYDIERELDSQIRSKDDSNRPIQREGMGNT